MLDDNLQCTLLFLSQCHVLIIQYEEVTAVEFDSNQTFSFNRYVSTSVDKKSVIYVKIGLI
uniref:Uncharacterized protein n=1 Tax=Octopus bimaculoides TaxID=37653 RepID=A0A0L8GZQ1_OCTBM